MAPRPTGRRPLVAGLLVTLLGSAVALASAGPAPAAVTALPARQPLVVLLGDHLARTRPSLSARAVETVAVRRPLSRLRTVLPVLAQSTNAAGHRWLRVSLPGRPNGHAGWIPAARTLPAATAWGLEVDLSARQVTVFRDGRVARVFRAVVGKASTPTPRGHFFVEEAVGVSARDTGGPFALATSARSEVLQEFDGGPGQIALHGTDGLAGALGSASSHGCVRLSPRAITWLARRVGRGVPVVIHA